MASDLCRVRSRVILSLSDSSFSLARYSTREQIQKPRVVASGDFFKTAREAQLPLKCKN